LHDIVNLPKDAPDRADASERSAAFARDVLPRFGFAPADTETIAEAIRDHSYSRDVVPQTPLGEALQDADRLEALGALGVLRTASCGARMGADYFDTEDPWAERRELDGRSHTIDHFFQKLLRLPDTMRTAAGREEARRRAEFLVAFLKQLGSEIGMAPPDSRLLDGGARGRGVDYEVIYREHAGEYDELVSAEDCDDNLIAALVGLAPLGGRRILEVGVGTGRIARKLVQRGAHVVGFDRAQAMLDVAGRRLREVSESGWELGCCDARRLPVASGAFDIAIAGWVFGHLRHWNAGNWRAEIGAAVSEMERAVAPGGTVVVIETLGTGSGVPKAPNAELAEYYAWLEESRGFVRTSIRTDYGFADVETAARVTGFFFGPDFARRARSEGWARVPECTGIWWKCTPNAAAVC
jgi:uncharacterized protein